MLPRERAKSAARQGDRVVQARSVGLDGESAVYLVDPVEWDWRGGCQGGCPGQWVKGIGPCQIGERVNKNNQPTGQILPAGNGEMA